MSKCYILVHWFFLLHYHHLTLVGCNNKFSCSYVVVCGIHARSLSLQIGNQCSSMSRVHGSAHLTLHVGVGQLGGRVFDWMYPHTHIERIDWYAKDWCIWHQHVFGWSIWACNALMVLDGALYTFCVINNEWNTH